MLLAVFLFNIKESDVSAISSSIWIELDGLQWPSSDELGNMDTRSSTDPSEHYHSNLPPTVSPDSDHLYANTHADRKTATHANTNTDTDTNQVIIASTKSSLSASMRTENHSNNDNDNGNDNGNGNDVNNDEVIVRDKERIGHVGNHSRNHDRNHLPAIPNQQQKIIERRGRKGRITCDFGTYSTYPKTTASLFETQLSGSEEWGLESNMGSHVAMADYVKENGKVRVSVDPRAVWRFIPVLFFGMYSFLNAFMGTLRLLAPLIFSRRAIVIVYKILGDYVRGRYVRKAYTRVEVAYIHYYETPATFRALCRTSSQLAVYFILSMVMKALTGITHPLCQSKSRRLASLCTLLWVGTVVGTGHAFAKALAIWGGPLRLQASPLYTRRRWTSVFTRPWHIFHWLQYIQNPEQWISMVSYPSLSFDPNPLIFPAAWFPLRLLQMVAVAQVAATDPSNYCWGAQDIERIPKLMRHFLFQLCLSDEWYRVFVGEKRLGLGVCVAIAYLFAMILLVVTSASINAKATLLMVPSFLAMIITGWMNIVIFFKQDPMKRHRI